MGKRLHYGVLPLGQQGNLSGVGLEQGYLMIQKLKHDQVFGEVGGMADGPD